MQAQKCNGKLPGVSYASLCAVILMSRLSKRTEAIHQEIHTYIHHLNTYFKFNAAHVYMLTRMSTSNINYVI
jgi:hypothetical protein